MDGHIYSVRLLVFSDIQKESYSREGNYREIYCIQPEKITEKCNRIHM